MESQDAAEEMDVEISKRKLVVLHKSVGTGSHVESRKGKVVINLSGTHILRVKEREGHGGGQIQGNF